MGGGGGVRDKYLPSIQIETFPLTSFSSNWLEYGHFKDIRFSQMSHPCKEKDHSDGLWDLCRMTNILKKLYFFPFMFAIYLKWDSICYMLPLCSCLRLCVKTQLYIRNIGYFFWMNWFYDKKRFRKFQPCFHGEVHTYAIYIIRYICINRHICCW